MKISEFIYNAIKYIHNDNICLLEFECRDDDSIEGVASSLLLMLVICSIDSIH